MRRPEPKGVRATGSGDSGFAGGEMGDFSF